MASWHQQQAINRAVQQGARFTLHHPRLWTAYSSKGFLSVMRFETREQAEAYCERTGDYLLPPDPRLSEGP